MTAETYPSGRQVITEYDTAGRAAGIRAAAIYYAGGSPSDATNRIQYASHGAVSVMKLGNGKWEHTTYDPKRLQPTLIGLGTSATDSSLLKLEYTYSNSDPSIHDNNGNVRTQKITIGSTVINQTYSYDALNRLQTATETGGWMQTYDCDRFGNRAVRAGSYIPTPALTPQSANSTDFSAFNQGNNRIQLNGFGYDAAGNLKNDPTTPANAILYDAENRQVSFAKGGTTTYSYDGVGHRVKKVTGSVTTLFVYNAMGQLTAEYTNDTTPPAGGGGTSYLTTDHLGSTRLVTGTNQTQPVKARYDYLPFGEEIPSNIGARGGVAGYGGADSTKQKFTQKERDTESGLDYFLARYYSSAQGRFTSTDPVIVTPERFYDPQQFNLYAYTRNNPLRFIDPTGEILTISGSVDEAQARLRSILGTPDADKRITYDAATNTLTVDLSGIDLTKNEGAGLLNDLVTSKNRYDLSIGSTVETLGGTISLDPKNRKPAGRDMVNLDNNPDDRFDYRKPPGKIDTEKPKKGIDDQVAFNLAGRSPRESRTARKPATVDSIIFHELAEAYAKVEHNKQYPAAHREAESREYRLREQRPNLREHNLGSGHFADRQIIRR